MNAILKQAELTNKDRADIRLRLFEEKKGDWQFVLDAITAANPRTAAIIKAGFSRGEGGVFILGCQQAVIEYIESELAEDAERDLLASKERNGKGWLTA